MIVNLYVVMLYENVVMVTGIESKAKEYAIELVDDLEFDTFAQENNWFEEGTKAGGLAVISIFKKELGKKYYKKLTRR